MTLRLYSVLLPTANFDVVPYLSWPKALPDFSMVPMRSQYNVVILHSFEMLERKITLGETWG